MKRWICLALALALLTLTLSGCRRKREAPAEEPSQDAPGYTATDGTPVQSEPAESVPDAPVPLTPQERAAMTVGTSDGADTGVIVPPGGDAAARDDQQTQVQFGAYNETNSVATQYYTGSAANSVTFQYSAVMDENVDYTFNYPTNWEHVPGIYTLCYREVVEKGDFPARIAITRKKLVHTPDEIAMMEQMTSFMKMVSERYDGATFQTSTPNKEAKFMGHNALSNTYLAYWGNIEVKGFVIGVAINRTLYVLHFCATYPDYIAMESALQYMVNSVQLKDTGKK